jgi:hypothetical protein
MREDLSRLLDAVLTWASAHPEAAAAIGIAAVSLGFSALVFWRQTRLQKQITRIEEERREEERRARREADVTVRFDSRQEQLRSGKTTASFMVVHNRGPAVARDVDVKLDGGGGQHLPLIPEGVLPIPFLDSGQEYQIRMFPALGEAFVFDAIVTWQDDEGPKEKRLRGGWS